VTGDEFKAEVAAELDLDAADKVLVDAIAAMLDDIHRTRSLRDRRSGYRLVNEMIRTFYARQAASEAGPSLSKSEAARKLAHMRWNAA